jgi:gamma-glutamyltranspeptidase/glutathione hydrolase
MQGRMRQFLFCWLIPGLAFAADPAPVASSGFMVVSAQHLASDIGADVLRRGGNAYDAMVATAYALAVVYPQAGNLGGGGFLTLRQANGHVSFIDFREKAPLAATPAMFLDAAGNVIPGKSSYSWAATGVPGTAAGLEYIRAHYGTMSRQNLLAPAIKLAKNGFVLSQADAGVYTLMAPLLAGDSHTASIFLGKNGEPLQQGDRLTQPDLARSLKLLADRGTEAGFYRGPIAKAIIAASSAADGILAQADFDVYKPRELAPVECDYRGYHIISAPPPSSGGTTICEILKILAAYDLQKMGFHSAAEIAVMTEAMRQAFIDRNNRLGDPDFWKNPVETLISAEHAAKLRTRINPAHATPTAQLPPSAPEGSETTQISIVDAAGNAAALTYTLNGWFGSGHVAGNTGILMNDEMDDFTSKIGQANMSGLVQGRANQIVPGKTPLSSMSPTIVTKDGKLVMVIGSPGASRIISIVLEAIINTVDHNMTMTEAIDAPRIHHQGVPDILQLERNAISPDTRALLAARGYVMQETGNWGCAEAIMAGGITLNPRDNGNGGYLPVTAAPPPGAKLFGAHDVRCGSGAAVP